MLEYILIFILNLLILLLLFKKDDLYSLFLSQTNDQSKIKADRLTSLASIAMIFIALLFTKEYSAGLIYTIALLFTGEYIPDNYWINLFVLIVTGGIFYREFKKKDDKEGSTTATIFLSMMALLGGYSKLDPIFTGITAFASFVYLIFHMGELNISSMTDAVMGKLFYVPLDMNAPIPNYLGFSILFFIVFLVIVSAGTLTVGNRNPTVIALSLVSMSLWASTWFKHKANDDGKGLKQTMKKLIPVLFLVVTIVRVIPFSYMTTGLQWLFGGLVAVLSVLFLVSAFQTKKTTINVSAVASLFQSQITDVPPRTYQILSATIVAFAGYFGGPILYSLINEFVQGGKVLLRDPVHLDKEKILSTYKELNKGKENFNYQYGISSYIYLDANNRNDCYQTIMDYGGKPRIQYNGAKNLLQIIVLDDYDKEKVVLTMPDFELQKWHHLAVNYLGGNLDVFLNGELIKSVSNVVPYMTMDDLIVGSSINDLNGGIKDVVYFDTPLTQTNLLFLS